MRRSPSTPEPRQDDSSLSSILCSNATLSVPSDVRTPSSATGKATRSDSQVSKRFRVCADVVEDQCYFPQRVSGWQAPHQIPNRSETEVRCKHLTSICDKRANYKFLKEHKIVSTVHHYLGRWLSTVPEEMGSEMVQCWFDRRRFPPRFYKLQCPPRDSKHSPCDRINEECATVSRPQLVLWRPKSAACGDSGETRMRNADAVNVDWRWTVEEVTVDFRCKIKTR